MGSRSLQTPRGGPVRNVNRTSSTDGGFSATQRAAISRQSAASSPSTFNETHTHTHTHSRSGRTKRHSVVALTSVNFTATVACKRISLII